MLLAKLPRHHRHDRRSLRTLDPHHDDPAPTPAFHVGDVFVAGEYGTYAIWYFDHAVTDAGGTVASLVINGHPGLSWELVAENGLMVDYGEDVRPDMPWSIAAGAVKGTDGALVAAESGTVAG